MQRDEVRRSAKRLEVDQFYANLPRFFPSDERVAREQLYVPPAQLARDGPSNITQANDSNCFARHPKNWIVTVNVPTPLLHSFLGRYNFARAREQQRNRMRRNFIDAVGRDVTHNDVCFCGGSDIDVVGSDPVADDDAAFLKLPDHVPGHVDAAEEDSVRLTTEFEGFAQGKFVGIHQLSSRLLNKGTLNLDARVAVLNENDPKHRYSHFGANDRT